MQTAALNWLCILPWFWPLMLSLKSHLLSHPISLNQQILLPLLQNLSKTQALLTILNSSTPFRPNHLHVSPRLIMIVLLTGADALNLRGELSTPQHRFLDRIRLCSFSIQNSSPKSLWLRSLYAICSPWPHRPHLLLFWPSVSSLTLNMPSKVFQIVPSARMFFLKVA